VKIKIKVNSRDYLTWFLAESSSDEDLKKYDRLYLYYNIAQYVKSIEWQLRV
jgi:hypothetical protein